MNADTFERTLKSVLAAYLIIVVLVLVAGCATTEPARTPQVTSGVKAEEVRVPVLVPCVTLDEVPKVPGTWMNEAQSKEKRRLAALADLKEAEAYILKADSLLRGCAKPKT